MNKTLGKLAITMTAALALGAGALATGAAAQSVAVLSLDLTTVLGYGELRDSNLELRSLLRPAGTPVKVAVTYRDGQTLVFDGSLGANGEVSLDKDANGSYETQLSRDVASAGVTLSLRVEKGVGATITLDNAAKDRLAAAMQRAADARAGGSAGAQDGAGAEAGAATEAEAQSGGASAGAEASGSVTVSAPVSAPVAPSIPPRR